MQDSEEQWAGAEKEAEEIDRAVKNSTLFGRAHSRSELSAVLLQQPCILHS